MAGWEKRRVGQWGAGGSEEMDGRMGGEEEIGKLKSCTMISPFLRHVPQGTNAPVSQQSVFGGFF
jgi:hypothetical protein